MEFCGISYIVPQNLAKFTAEKRGRRLSLHSADVIVTSSKYRFYCIWVNNVLYNNFNKFKCIIAIFGNSAVTETESIFF